MDLEKLKVVDLRKELQQRGLDTKGNKAVLVKRLKDAMDKESDSGTTAPVQQDSGDEGPNNEEEQSEEEAKPPIKESPRKEEMKKEAARSPAKEEARTPRKVDPKPQKAEELKTPENVSTTQGHPETNGDQDAKAVHDEEESGLQGEKMETETRGEKRKRDDDDDGQDTETREEKRRCEEKGSPEKPPVKKRELTPPREDEPEIDYEKPHLSWYDSDLHLKVDKKSFLSAKPLNEGCMGYLWAGARATYGITSGKVCYEVKITEELKWEDLSKYLQERKEREERSQKYKIDRRKDKNRTKKDVKADDKTSSEKTENKEGDNENSEKNTEKSNAEVDAEQSQEKMETQNESVTAEASETKDAETVESSEEKAPEGETKDGEADASQKVESEENAEKKEEKPKVEPIPAHYFRVGFSMLGTSLQLGEDKYSFAYESTGKFVTNKQFQDYGVPFGVGDVIGAYLNIDEEFVTITFTVNGALQPTAITLPLSEFPEENFSLFPHVLCRNYAYEMNFGANEEPWFPNPEELQDYQFLQEVEEKVAGPRRPETRSECEVVLMIGLPGSGKTTWVKKHLESTTDKIYTVIGNTPIFERMTVDGQPLKSRFGGSWRILVDKIQKCLNTLTDIASLRRRNFIIDQTNVFPNAQRRKLRAFEGFKRKAVCVVCEDEEHARRQKEYENDYGKKVPESIMLDLKAQMELPQKCEWVDEIEFTDLTEEESRKKLKHYTDEANKKGYFRRWHVRQDDKKGLRNMRDRRGFGGRYGRYDRHPQSGWNRPSAGGWGRDRRDSRGPPPRHDAWRQSSRGPRPQERERTRENRSGGGYSRNYGGGRNSDVWQSSGSSGWGSSGNQPGWNAQMYGSHGYGAWSQQGQGGWKYTGNQSGYSSGGGGYGSGNQSGYGGNQGGYGGGQGGGYGGSSQGGYGQQNWNYYGQYGQQQGWGSGQVRY